MIKDFVPHTLQLGKVERRFREAIVIIRIKQDRSAKKGLQRGPACGGCVDAQPGNERSHV